MNNGDYNRPPSPETEGPARPYRERKPFFPLLVLIFGIIGIVNPPFGVAAAVLGFIDRHTSETWDGKSRVGTVLGCVITGLCVLGALFCLLLYLLTPNFGAGLAQGVRDLATIYSSAIRKPF